MSLLYLIVAIPAASAAILLLGGKATDAWGHLLGCAASLAAFVVGVIAFVDLSTGSADALSQHLFTWIDVHRFHVEFNMLFDPLSGLFVLLITGVGSLIHIYAVGYMEHDPRRRRFFGYFNLFIASMLLLVAMIGAIVLAKREL